MAFTGTTTISTHSVVADRVPLTLKSAVADGRAQDPASRCSDIVEYTAAVFDVGDGFCATFPDLDSSYATNGDTLEEVEARLKDLLVYQLKRHLQEKKALPEAQFKDFCDLERVTGIPTEPEDEEEFYRVLQINASFAEAKKWWEIRQSCGNAG